MSQNGREDLPGAAETSFLKFIGSRLVFFSVKAELLIEGTSHSSAKTQEPERRRCAHQRGEQESTHFKCRFNVLTVHSFGITEIHLK